MSPSDPAAAGLAEMLATLRTLSAKGTPRPWVHEPRHQAVVHFWTRREQITRDDARGAWAEILTDHCGLAPDDRLLLLAAANNLDTLLALAACAVELRKYADDLAAELDGQGGSYGMTREGLAATVARFDALAASVKGGEKP